MFPQIPENLADLTPEAAAAFGAEAKAALKAAYSNAQLSADDFAVAVQYEADLNKAQDARKATLAQKADQAARAAALEAEEAPEPEVPAEPEAPAPAPAPAPEASEEVSEPVVEPAAASTPKVSTTFGQSSAPVATLPARAKKITAEHLVAAEGVPGMAGGEGFADWSQLAEAAIKRSANIRAGSGENYTVALLKGDYPKDRILTEDLNFNMAKFERDELTAALCAPATPYYDLACMNTLRRPVFNSLPQFQAPRGKVSIMASPTLSDITTGVGLWTAANEASTNAVKSACQTITCGSPTEYQIYGVYRCLTVRNLLAMTYPELVEAWLNRLGAAHARLAEINLLNAMGTASTSITAPLLGYGAATTITTTLLNYLALYQETQRWDYDGPMDFWAHRTVLTGIKMDIARRRRTSGEWNNMVPTDEQVNAMFRNAGFNPHWFIDTPTWATAIAPVATANVLNRLPADVSILVAPPGKYAVMDRGELSIGVTGNGIYRDNNSNSRNEFTFFFENFEGIVNTDSCPNHIITIPVCWNGTQIDDVVMNCQGGDEGGFQS